jgi:hypothetical protein
MKGMQEKRENKYAAGDKVYAKVDPNVELVVRRFVDRIYYCRFPHESDRKELVFFERELV